MNAGSALVNNRDFFWGFTGAVIVEHTWVSPLTQILLLSSFFIMFILVRSSALAGEISCSLTAADHHLRSDPDLA